MCSTLKLEQWHRVQKCRQRRRVGCTCVDLSLSLSFFLIFFEPLGSYFSSMAFFISMSPLLAGRFNHLSYRTTAAQGGALFIFPSSCMCTAKKLTGRSTLNPRPVSARIGRSGKKKTRTDNASYGFLVVESLSIHSVQWMTSTPGTLKKCFVSRETLDRMNAERRSECT